MKNYFSNLFKKQDKQAVVAVGGFEAAAFTRDRSHIYTFDDNTLATQDTYSRQELTSLSRYLVNNYPLFERILSVSEVYGIGSGIIANAATTDSEFNQKATDTFDKWASSCFCSVNNQYNLYEMQKLIVREFIIAGEVFIVLVKSPETNYPQLMLVNTENVRHSGLAGDNSINGLYVDGFGKVTAYNIFTGSSFQKVDASNVIHLMRHKQIGQLRGVTHFAASLNAARDHKDCIVLEKKAIKVHSALAAVIKKESGNAGNGGAFGNVVPNPTVAPAGNSTPAVNRGLEKAFSGSVIYTGKDEDVKLISSQRSSDGFIKFLELLIRDVCLDLSLPYEFLVNADKLTSAGIRFTIADASFYFNSLQTVLIDGFLNRLYSWVIASMIKDGKLEAPANGDMPWNVSFVKPISVTIDQNRVSNTEIALLQNSLLTYDAYYSARGKNWQQELTQKAKEEAFLNDLSKAENIDINRLRTLQAGSSTIEPVHDVAPVEDIPAA